MAGWSFRGPDMGSATHAEMAALSARLNSVLRLGSGWMIQCDAIRSRAPEYPGEGAFPDEVTALIDEERRQQFLAEGAHYESEYFLTLTYLPPEETEEKVKGWMFDGKRVVQIRRTTRARLLRKPRGDIRGRVRFPLPGGASRSEANRRRARLRAPARRSAATTSTDASRPWIIRWLCRRSRCT